MIRIDNSCKLCRASSIHNGGGGGGGCDCIDVVVVLPADAMTPIDIVGLNQQGSYLMTIKSVNANGATAVFSVSSATDVIAGSVVRLTESPSATGERIDVTWAAGQLPQLYHAVTKTGAVGGETISYNVSARGL
jgi:hypothetical protein